MGVSSTSAASGAAFLAPTGQRAFFDLAGLNEAPDETVLTPRDVAAVIGNSRDTLRRWRRLKKGPPFFPIEGRPRCRLGDLRSWIIQQAQAGN